MGGGGGVGGGGYLEGELFVESLVCSGVFEILLSRYTVDRVRCELWEPKKGVVGSYYHRPRYVSQREIKKLVGLM